MSTLEERASDKLDEVPAARWTYPEAIAEAIGQPGAARAVGQALGAGPQHNHNTRPADWARNYQRLRQKTGRFKAPQDTIEKALIERESDALWIAEGGRFDAPGVYAASQRWDFGSSIKVTVTVEISPERRAVLDERAAERKRRMSGDR